MSLRHTIERLLRDNDDASGQSIRQWCLQKDSGHITVRQSPDSEHVVILRIEDVDLLIADLTAISEVSAEEDPS